MRTILELLFIPVLVFACFSCGDGDNNNNPPEDFVVTPYEPVAVTKTNNMKLYVHYMPWFETPESSTDKKWGQHWTMANCNPDKIDSNGKREIAAHYYPLIGPYASSDPDVIEYHLLLMKYAGIDGILIDWYGTRDLWDYPANKKNTEALVQALDKVGLEFAIVYEDQTLREQLSEVDQIAQAKSDMRYLENNFFNRDNYIKVNNKPLLLTFGPQEIDAPSDWTAIFNVLNSKPVFVTLYGHIHRANNAANQNAAGEFIWVDDTSMETKYNTVSKDDVWLGGAYPGFNAYYKDGGWGNNPLAKIDYENGALFKRLLEMSKAKNTDYLQLITWNDFGEGTMIEPTQEFRYSFLTQLQQFAGMSYTQTVLDNIYQMYKIRKAHKTDKLIQKKMDQAFYYWVSLQADKASELINIQK